MYDYLNCIQTNQFEFLFSGFRYCIALNITLDIGVRLCKYIMFFQDHKSSSKLCCSLFRFRMRSVLSS